MQTISEALGSLDVTDDSLWTDDGAPMVDAVAKALGRPVSRQDIIEEAPQFTRASGKLAEAPAPEVEDKPVAKAEVSMSVRGGLSDEETVAEYRSLIAEMQEEYEELREAIKEKQDELNQFVTKHIEPFSHQSDQDARMAFIRSQTETRAKKFGVHKALLGGLSPDAIDPRAPIDRAMSRKNARGSSRPARPPMNG